MVLADFYLEKHDDEPVREEYVEFMAEVVEGEHDDTIGEALGKQVEPEAPTVKGKKPRKSKKAPGFKFTPPLTRANQKRDALPLMWKEFERLVQGWDVFMRCYPEKAALIEVNLQLY